MKPCTIFNEKAFQNFFRGMRKIFAKAYTKNLYDFKYSMPFAATCH